MYSESREIDLKETLVPMGEYYHVQREGTRDSESLQTTIRTRPNGDYVHIVSNPLAAIGLLYPTVKVQDYLCKCFRIVHVYNKNSKQRGKATD